MPAGLLWFLGASFWNGIVIELGRKIRAPEQEEHGVDTYSFLWGPTIAVSSWLAAMAATLVFAVMAAREITFLAPVVTTLGLLWLGGATLGIVFLRTPRGKLAKGIESYSGLWSLGLYLMLGVAPLCLRK